MYIADLHIHSHYSRATSRDCDAPHLAMEAKNKGIALVGSGDFTHPAYRTELRESLVRDEAAEGFYTLREELRLPAAAKGGIEPRFVITGEISTIYKKKDRTRKIHSLLLLPSLETADALALRLERIGNIHSDGRPILGLDCHDLLEITLETVPKAIFIPAHIWTPHFALFGAFSGFDRMEDCFEDLTGEIHALETGLSSDPPMNWRLSALDGFTLVSNSDAHSPAKLGREANLIDAPLSYPALHRAIQTGEGFYGTLEFFPEEGKYHYDGHRNCSVSLSPRETEALGGRCPVCGKKLTIGVEHRVCALADRPYGFKPEGAKPFESLIPLLELIASAEGLSAAGQKAQAKYRSMLQNLGPEFYILREAPLDGVERQAGPCMAEALRRLRAGQVERIPGYDGRYGEISVLSPAERKALLGQTAMFAMEEKRSGKRERLDLPAPVPGSQPAQEAPPADASLNEEQLRAVLTKAPVAAVAAGPGTGKTKTLVARIVHLMEDLGVKPTEITAVTFTRLAAKEMRERLEACLGKRALRGITIGTFHAVALELLDKKPILSEAEALALMAGVLHRLGADMPPREALKALSRVKGGLSCTEAGLPEAVCQAYCHRCKAQGLRDLDDILLEALALPSLGKRCFHHLLVDEFQDSSPVQRQLVRHWAKGGKSLFVIGDPDQSIYGFRGADASCFEALAADFPGMERISLVKNYRSSPAIVSAALSVIGHNPGPARGLTAMAPEGEPVRLLKADTPFAEAMWIAKEIGRLTGGMDMHQLNAEAAEGARAFSEIAVLSRTHRQLELIENCLIHDSIPCLVSGRGDILEDEAVQRALGFFHALLQPSLPCPEGLASFLEEFLPLLGKAKPQQLLARYMAEQGSSKALERLLDMSLFHNSMEDFLSAIALGQEADLRRAAGKAYASGAVRLMTLHGAKGLEFPVVFLSGLSQGSLPLVRVEGKTDMEEERRLLFVGLTRARERLYLTGYSPYSDFLAELGEGLEALPAPKRPERAEQLRMF